MKSRFTGKRVAVLCTLELAPAPIGAVLPVEYESSPMELWSTSGLENYRILSTINSDTKYNRFTEQALTVHSYFF